MSPRGYRNRTEASCGGAIKKGRGFIAPLQGALPTWYLSRGCTPGFTILRPYGACSVRGFAECWCHKVYPYVGGWNHWAMRDGETPCMASVHAGGWGHRAMRDGETPCMASVRVESLIWFRHFSFAGWRASPERARYSEARGETPGISEQNRCTLKGCDKERARFYRTPTGCTADLVSFPGLHPGLHYIAPRRGLFRSGICRHRTLEQLRGT